VNKVLLPLVFSVIALSLIGYQDAAAMTLLFENPFDGSAFIFAFDVDASNTILADDFVLSTDASVEDVHFFIFDPDGVFDDVVFYTIYPDLGGVPDPTSPIASGTGANVMKMPACGFPGCFEVWIDIVPAVPLSAGTYWIALSGQTTWKIIFDDTPELTVMHFSQDGGTSFGPIGGFGIPLQITGNENDEIIGGGGSDQAKTKPTFGLDHRSFQPIVEGGFSFNGVSHDITDNFWTPFNEKPVRLGTINTFTAKVYADKGLRTQEFLFGIPEVGKAQDAEVVVEVWYDTQKNIIDTIVSQKTNVVDADSLTVIHSMNNCSSENNLQCDVTSISIKFLEPLFNKVMAINAVDLKNRGQLTYQNEGFDISGDSLNPMLTLMIPGPEKYEGLITITQNEKYSNLWTAEDGRIFDANNYFKEINPTLQKGFNDSRNSEYQRMYLEGQAYIGSLYFDSSKIQGSDKGFVAAIVNEGMTQREQTLQSLVNN